MRGRVIGAVWIIAALCLFYFGWNGEYFTALFLYCCLMAAAEICIVVYGENWRMQPLACQPLGLWAIQLLILFFASFALLLIQRDQLVLVGLVCIFSDVGAFACGKLFGKHRVYALQSISPKKTWEGYVGGTIIAWLAGWLVCLIFHIAFTPGVIAYIVLGGVTAEIGDIIGSGAKRQLGLKDSGEALRNYPVAKWLEWPIRGHGGYLDRVDSISLGIVVFAIINLAS